MKKIILILFWIISLATNSFASNTKTTLSGKVIDAKTGETMPGVSIYLPDLKTGAITNSHGEYSIENLPSKTVLIQVTFIGYQTIIEQVDLTSTSIKNFELRESVKEIHDLIVTGMSKATERNRTPNSIAAISHIQLLQQSSTNLMDAISSQPGISQITTGSGISKPVIRGLGYNRVVVVNDGIRQEGQQWGDEHGIEIDENGVHKVEILKGPASLAFGSDAMAGVVNLIAFPTLPPGKISGTITSNYQTNNGMYNLSGNLVGNLKGIIWDLRYSNKASHAYKNKYDGYVYNSGMKEHNLDATIGINKSWGYSHLKVSAYHLQPGIIEGTRDSSSGHFLKEVRIDDSTSSSQLATNNDFISYNPQTPYQQIDHYKAVFNHNFFVRDGSLKLILGYQQNRRKEFADILQPMQYGLYFLMNTMNYDIRYVLPEMQHWNLSLGVNGMYQSSQNKGSEFLVPQYHLFDIGGFFIAKKNMNQLDISAGIRYDIRQQHGEKLILDNNGWPSDLDSATYNHKFVAFNSVFQGVTGSIGAAYQISKKVYAKLNLSRGFRAPNIAELGANGEHEGTGKYEIGDSKLKPENSWELDAAFGLNTEHITLEVDLFDNRIQHFIYQRKLNSVFGNDSIRDGLSTFKFVQGDANLIGGEITMDIHPHPFDWLHFENSFSYVNATQLNQPDSLQHLPFIPPAKLRTELKFEKPLLGSYIRNAYFTISLEHYFAQNNYFSAFGTETATSSYSLINTGWGGVIQYHKKTYGSLFFNLNNITNTAYQSHLSRLKYTDINYQSGRRGVYNMGRNFSIKLIIPFTFKNA